VYSTQSSLKLLSVDQHMLGVRVDPVVTSEGPYLWVPTRFLAQSLDPELHHSVSTAPVPSMKHTVFRRQLNQSSATPFDPSAKLFGPSGMLMTL
jgi:hypothetical protein